MTKDGLRKPNYFGSLTHAATVRLRARLARQRTGTAGTVAVGGTFG